MSRWKICYGAGLLMCLVACVVDAIEAHLRNSHLVKREADYTLDESFWIEESPAGEVERLLREYTQNQEMVRNIGSHYYQIIYPVQLRQHKKMGISTREIGSSKVRNARSTRQNDGGGGYEGRGRQTKTGKHFHRTSLLIKAFNHKFRLDLELNTQLIAPNVMQKHYLANGAEQVSKQDIEHCYYHGKVQDYPGATAAFHTCNGVSGVIHVGNETFVIHPFYGGDLSKHPHVIFEARTKANKGCATTSSMEWRLNQNFMSTAKKRMKRDIRDATKYIETALIIDKAMFEKRNGSTRIEVVHDSIQVANIADLYFRTLNTRVSVVYIETWQGGNQAQINRNLDIGNALSSFNEYTSRKLFTVDKDTTQLLTGEIFVGEEAGIAVPATVCTQKSVGISVDINTYEPHLLAGTMAHMIGHNIGMGHDDGREECFCKDWHGCIMAKSIIGLENVQPYKFSECSMADYIDRLRTGTGVCLLNKPNELQDRRTCGNNKVEEGEDCDCGSIDNCKHVDPCCDPITCKLTKEAECATGTCCHQCRFMDQGIICRNASNECDLPEKCSGESGDCPSDVYKINGSPCGSKIEPGKCFEGFCPTFKSQCEYIWDTGSTSADKMCYDIFNTKGSVHGHCGMDIHGNFQKCTKDNIRCGSLQCKFGNLQPREPGLQFYVTTTNFGNMKGTEYECKTVLKEVSHNDGIPLFGLVRDGTPCGTDRICINQTCVTPPPAMPTGCPSNNKIFECSGHGSCTNENRCFCELGYTGSDCSIIVEVTPPPPQPTHHVDITTTSLQEHMIKKETPYGENHTNRLSTFIMAGVLVLVVMLVFVCFALMASCYRRNTESNLDTSGTVDMVPLRTGGSISSFGRTDSQRVLYRPANHMSVDTPYQTHTMTPLTRMSVSGAEDIEEIGGEDEGISYRELHSNHKMQEKKGILKKHDYSMLMSDGKEGRGGGIQADSNLRRSPTHMSQLIGGSTTDVERTLRTLNGYHDSLVQTLRKAAAQRGSEKLGSTSTLSEELLRRSLQKCTENYSDFNKCRVGSSRGSKENICEPELHQVIIEHEEDDDIPPCGTLRIRNLEDLIRQLEHHSRHMSPSGSEDIRMSETEADRHYRQESSSVCSESSHQSHSDTRFTFGRYRQPSARMAYPPSHREQHQEEEGIYESADHERDNAGCPDMADSESDDFIQAQQHLARWASDDTVGGSERSAGGGGGGGSAGGSHCPISMREVVPTGGPPSREYFPSPSSSTSEEPPSIARAPAVQPHPDHATIHRPKRYPEYKH